MTKEQKIKVLAELDGWNHWFNGWNKLDDNTPPLILTEQLPRYLTSYDVIIPLIQKQPSHIRTWTEKALGLEYWVAAVMATPEQLSDALIKAHGKWEE